MLFAVGFVLGAGCVTALGVSLLEDHDRRLIVPATAVTALACGLAVGWALNYFVHWASPAQ